jgi:hypothetical protein
MLRRTCLALLLPTAAWSQTYVDNATIATFRDKPCTEVLDVIYLEEAAGDSLAEVIGTSNRVNLYLGFVIGFDVAHGGLQGDAESTLARLRAACATEPQTPALSLLQGFVEEQAPPLP